LAPACDIETKRSRTRGRREIGGLIYGAVLPRVAAHWIAVGAIVLLGLAILTGVKATRQRDPS
jgi:hypothetical protein